MPTITGDVHVFTVYAKKDQALMSPLTKVIRKYQCFLSLIFNVQPVLDVCAIPDHIRSFTSQVKEWIDLNRHFSEDDMPKTKPVADDLQSTTLRSTNNDDDVQCNKNQT